MTDAAGVVKNGSDFEHRRFVVKRLVDLAARAGRVPGEQCAHAAAAMGVSQRTVLRWVAAGSPPPRRVGEHYRLTERDLDLYFELAGNVARVRQQLLTEGANPPSRTTLSRAFRRELTAGQRAHARTGAQGLRAERLTLAVDVDRRNAVWEADHKELAVEVIPRHGARPVRPWVTLFLDAYSRAIMGYAINLRQSAADVIAALHAAIVIDEARGPFGGVPEVVRWDGGLEFLSNAVTEVVQTVGAVAKPTPPYSPHLKGKVERLKRTIEQQFLSGLPGWTGGPHSASGELYGPEGRMSLEGLVARFDEWVLHYNNERAHESLDDRTPLEAWNRDSTPVRQIDPAEIRWLLPSARVRMSKEGIRFARHRFYAPELVELVAEELTVRYMPHDTRQVHVYRDGEFLCTAYPQDTLTAEERDRLIAQRREEHRRAAAIRRRVSRRQAVRLAPLTKPGSPDTVTEISREETRREGGLRSDQAVRLEGRLDMIDLGELDVPFGVEHEGDRGFDRDGTR